jgi:hypothetical protein
VEGCSQGKLTLKLTQGEASRRVEFEFRGYTTEVNGEESEKTGGLYVNSIKDKESVPLNAVISHVGVSFTKRL